MTPTRESWVVSIWDTTQEMLEDYYADYLLVDVEVDTDKFRDLVAEEYYNFWGPDSLGSFPSESWARKHLTDTRMAWLMSPVKVTVKDVEAAIRSRITGEPVPSGEFTFTFGDDKG